MVELSEFSREKKEVVVETKQGKVRLTFLEWKHVAEGYNALVEKKIKMNKDGEAVTVQINQDEPGEIELIMVDNASHLATYFTLEEWEKFRELVANYDVVVQIPVHSEGRISVTIDYQLGDDVTLHLNDNNIMTMIGFTFANWEKFKKEINEFKVDKNL